MKRDSPALPSKASCLSPLRAIRGVIARSSDAYDLLAQLDGPRNREDGASDGLYVLSSEDPAF
jgi:hypothetical protein